MGEAISSTIAQQLAVVSSSKGAAQTLTLPVLLTELPPVLSDVTRPLSINGTLIGMLSPQDLSLRTSVGAIKVALATVDQDLFATLAQTLGDKNAPLPPITLYLDKGGASSKGLLTLPMPEKVAATSQGVSLTEGASRSQSLQPMVPQALTVPLGKPIQALVLAPLPASPSLTPTAATQTDSKGGLFSDFVQPSEAAQQPSAPSVQASASSSPAPTAAKAPVQASVQQLPEPQSVTIHDVQPSEGKSAPTLPQTSGKTFHATVTGHMPSGNPILTSGKATILLQEPIPLSVGSKLVVSLSPWQEADQAVLPMLSSDITADLAQSYLAALPETAAQTGLSQAAVLPTPTNHLAGTLLFFLSALHSGKMEEWLPSPRFGAFYRGDKGDKASSKTALIDALTDPEMVQAHDTKMGQWHCYPIPVHADGFCQTLRLYVHQDGSRQEEDKGHTSAAKKTRFVVTLTMSKLGAMQLDGLARPKVLDLVLRSEKTLPLALVNEIRSSTLASFEAIGLKGSILFQSGEANWINFHHSQPSLGVEV